MPAMHSDNSSIDSMIAVRFCAVVYSIRCSASFRAVFYQIGLEVAGFGRWDGIPYLHPDVTKYLLHVLRIVEEASNNAAAYSGILALQKFNYAFIAFP